VLAGHGRFSAPQLGAQLQRSRLLATALGVPHAVALFAPRSSVPVPGSIGRDRPAPGGAALDAEPWSAVEGVMRPAISLASCLSAVLVACGGGKKPAATPTETGDGAAAEAAADEAAPPAPAGGEASAEGIPTTCVDQHGTCVPPRAFVDRLCQGSFPGVALVMFEKSSPWKRGYMRAEVEPVNASGGMTGEGKLLPGEEVLIVRVRAQPAGGMQVTGAGGWDVLRWDGTCATVSEGEMGFEQNGHLKAAVVTFRYLDEPIREALRTNAAVDEAYQNRRRHCKGATMGEVSQECEKWDRKLTEAVVATVRGGIELPTPEKLP